MEEKPVEECKIMDAESLRWNVNRFPRRGFPSNVPTLIGEEPNEAIQTLLVAARLSFYYHLLIEMRTCSKLS